MKAKSGLLIVALVALLMRALFVLFFGVPPALLDAQEYKIMAENILAGQALDAPRVGEPDLPIRVPLYGYFIALVYRAFGVSEKAVVVVQILVSTLLSVLVRPEQGAYLAWFRPMYGTDDGNVYDLLDAGGIGVSYDGSGASPVVRCEAGGVVVTETVAFSADTWVFLACVWDAAAGLDVFRLDGDAVQTSQPGAFEPPAAPEDPVGVAPTWSLVGEIRLHQRALSVEEVESFVTTTKATYGQ